MWDCANRISMSRPTPFIQKTKALLKNSSPLGSLVSYEVVKRGSKMNAVEALEMDFRVSSAFFGTQRYFRVIVDNIKRKEKDWGQNDIH